MHKIDIENLKLALNTVADFYLKNANLVIENCPDYYKMAELNQLSFVRNTRDSFINFIEELQRMCDFDIFGSTSELNDLLDEICNKIQINVPAVE